jgi:hypothetical protein
MECLWDFSGRNADSLPPPEGLDRYAVLRSLDRQYLAEVAPDVPRERRQRIVKIRDEIRRGVYETPERLDQALDRAIPDAFEPPRPRPRIA